MDVTKKQVFEITIKLDKDEVKALERLIGNSTTNERMKISDITKEQDKILEILYDEIVNATEKGDE